MIKVSTASILLTIYISTLQGSAGSDDYEIVLPRVVPGQNLTWAMVGPRYTVDKPVMLEILGPREYNVQEGKELALICQDKNNRQNNKIAWRRKDGLMPNGERSVLGGQVIIERIGREDGGEYQCWDLVTNRTNTHKYVNVLYAPRVTVDKLYLSHHSQLTLELVCSAQANPTASITWSRLEPHTGAWVELIEDPTETGVWTVDRQVDSSEKLSVVVIQNPMLAHLGHYVCRANNSLGNDFKTVHLKGFNEEVQTPMPVTMSGSSMNKDISQILIVTFVCNLAFKIIG